MKKDKVTKRFKCYKHQYFIENQHQMETNLKCFYLHFKLIIFFKKKQNKTQNHQQLTNYYYTLIIIFIINYFKNLFLYPFAFSKLVVTVH